MFGRECGKIAFVNQGRIECIEYERNNRVCCRQ